MKKTILFAVVLLVSGVFTSCLRDDDLEIFRHPIHLSGHANPQFGIPVATGELNMNNLLTSLSAEYTGMIDSTKEIITVTYSAEAHDTIKAASALSSKSASRNLPSLKPAATKDFTWFPKDTVFSDTIDVDFFNDVDNLHGHIDIDHIWLNFGARVYGYCPSSYRQFIKGQFDRLVINYEDHDGAPRHFNYVVPPINFDNITDTTIRQFDSVDVASIVNDMPRKIIATFRFRLYIRSDLLDSILIKSIPYETVLDSLRMTELVYNANLNVSMPLSVEINNLNYVYNLDLGDGLSSVNLDSILSSISQDIHVDIERSRFRMVFHNGIPLQYTLNADMLDAGGNRLFNVYQDKVVESANLIPDPNSPDPSNPQYVAGSDKETILDAILYDNDIDKLSQAKTLRLKLKVDTQNKHVCVRREDYMKFKAYLVTNPAVSIDIPITNNGIL